MDQILIVSILYAHSNADIRALESIPVLISVLLVIRMDYYCFPKDFRELELKSSLLLMPDDSRKFGES